MLFYILPLPHPHLPLTRAAGLPTCSAFSFVAFVVLPSLAALGARVFGISSRDLGLTLPASAGFFGSAAVTAGGTGAGPVCPCLWASQNAGKTSILCALACFELVP